MKLSVILILLTSPCLLAGHRKDRIVGGHESKPHSHPYLVSLQMRFLWARFRICSGSLLNTRWILTAGHCVKGSWIVSLLTMEAILGSNDIEHLESTSQRVRIQERIPHPFYLGGIGPYDIAMLKTDVPVTYTDAIRPIELPFPTNDRNQFENLVVAGWGVLKTTAFLPDLPDKLQEANVNIISYRECYEAIDDLKDDYESNPLDRKANLCTGPLTGGVAACSGDSGGPLIQYLRYVTEEPATSTDTIVEEVSTTTISHTTLEDIEATTIVDPTVDNISITENNDVTDPSIDENTIEIDPPKVKVRTTEEYHKEDKYFPVVIGVVSWGVTPCGEKGAPTVYTNVSNYLDFINQYINN